MTVPLPVKGTENWDISLNQALTYLDNNTTAAVAGSLLAANNLSDLTNKPQARTNLGLTGLANAQSNLTATTNPTTSSDNTQGYSAGSTWLNTTTNTIFICANAATGAAIWYNYVDSSTNQTVGGAKTFTGMVISSRSIDSSTFAALYSATNTTNAAYSYSANAATGRFLSSVVSGDTLGRYASFADGSATYGNGTVTRDTSTGRAAVGTFYTSPNLLVGSSTDLGDNGVGVIKLANTTTVPTGTPPTGGFVFTSVAGQPGYVNPHGLSAGVSAGISAVTATTTVNTTGLQALVTGTIPANDPETGAIYEMLGYGVFTTNATATTVVSDLYWGTTGGTLLTSLAAASLTASLTNAPFRVRATITFRSTTSAVAMFDFFLGTSATTGAGSGLMSITSAPVTVTTTAANTFTFAINLNNAQTFTLLGGDLRRVR